MAELPEVITTGYKVFGDPTAITDIGVMTAAITSVLKASWKLDTKLYAFFKRFEKGTSGPEYWTQLSPGFNKSIGGDEIDIFPVAFQFPDPATAYTCMLYWTTTSILWSGMSFIYLFLSALPMPPSPEPQTHPLLALFPSLDHRAQVSEPAKNVCQSVEYFFHPGLGETAATSTVFPLKVAIEALHGDPDCKKEVAWASKAFEMIAGGENGVKILKHLGVELTDRNYLPG